LKISKNSLKITEFKFQNSGPSFFASVAPVYCKKKLTRFEQFTKLTEEIHFEVCHSGNLPPIVACRGSTGSVAGGVHRQSTTDVQIQKCCVHIIQRFRTGRIWNWGRSELGAQSGRKNQPLCAIYISNCLNVWQIVLMLLYKTTFFYFFLISITLFL